MKTFTAKQLHEKPSEVYRAAVKSAVIINHRNHGKFIFRGFNSEFPDEKFNNLYEEWKCIRHELSFPNCDHERLLTDLMQKVRDYTYSKGA